jgi:hypothetical protein
VILDAEAVPTIDVSGQVRDVLATAGEGKLEAGLFTDLAGALKGVKGGSSTMQGDG